MTASSNPASSENHFARGVEQFNLREFFAAHESWEVIWLPAPEPDKTFLQGITQVSAGFFHLSRGNRLGAMLQLSKGLAKLARFPADYRGIELEGLRRSAAEWLESLQVGKELGGERLPQIAWRDSPETESGRPFSLPPESEETA